MRATSQANNLTLPLNFDNAQGKAEANPNENSPDAHGPLMKTSSMNMTNNKQQPGNQSNDEQNSSSILAKSQHIRTGRVGGKDDDTFSQGNRSTTT